MAKYLTLLRHGEAEPAHGFKGDFSRNLSDNGKYRLNRLGAILKERAMFFDISYVSSAQRTQETADIIDNYLSITNKEIKKDLYLADVDIIFDTLRTVSDEINQVILIGHNPGISGALAMLTNDFQINMTPGMMAILELHADSWEVGINRGMGTLKEVIQ
ncbi:SixA phosphatase family protein [Echinicola shivajiensis]|uniref:SixA phosphatase family protein n=1 Tax=Echinicola shivajiensis TaxID=1035916 RepID=UPI001BFC2B13|nr:histidine phosphatase family protein [Echinicola shivajiensis]